MEKEVFMKEGLELYSKLASAEFRKEKEEAIQAVCDILGEWNRKESEKTGRIMIQAISGRIKTPKSIIDKLHKKEYEISDEGIKRLNDMAGVRAVCPFLDDVYQIRDFVMSCDRIRILKEKDYIVRPKKTGYQSLHLILEVFIEGRKKWERVELQIRTLAMDFWSGLEHPIIYKQGERADKMIGKELKAYASMVAILDKWLLEIRKEVT